MESKSVTTHDISSNLNFIRINSKDKTIKSTKPWVREGQRLG